MNLGTSRSRPSDRMAARGFTLLEMMLVVVIMGLLIGVSSVAILSQGETAKIKTTRASMATVASTIKNYNLQEGAYPPSLDVLVPKYLEKTPVDAWKRPIVYIPTGSGAGTGAHPFTLYSLGKSGEQGSADVIDYWEEDQPNH